MREKAYALKNSNEDVENEEESVNVEELIERGKHIQKGMKGNKSCARKGSNGPEEESSKQKRTMKKLAIRERENESVKGMKKIVNGDVENQVEICQMFVSGRKKYVHDSAYFKIHINKSDAYEKVVEKAVTQLDM